MHEQSEEFGFLYYSRFFRGRRPLPLAPLLMAIGTISLPGDGDMWSVTVLGAAGDRPLKRLTASACARSTRCGQGLERPPPADRQAAVRAALMPAALRDADVLRAMPAERCCLGSPTALDEPELAERVLELAGDAEPAPPAGPDRKRLMTLLA
jgi:hypothetical protein